MSSWKWTTARDEGIWRHGAPWVRPLFAAVPWITLLVLCMNLWMVGGTLTASKGVLFDLPAAGLGDGEATGMVALVMPVGRETMVFFDDSRFMLGDAASAQAFAEQLGERLSRTDRKSLLVLADRRTSGGDLMEFAAIARKSGVERVLFAEKRPEEAEE